MSETKTERNDPTGDDETSEMRFGAGETAWLAVVTVLALLGVALGVLALVVATGDSGDSGGTAAPPGGAASEATVSASEFAFDPSDIPLAAGEVSVTLDNAGAVEHNFTVLEAGETVSTEGEFNEDMVLGAVGNTAAGESNSADLTLEPGEYQVICTIPGHLDAGMAATITAG